MLPSTRVFVIVFLSTLAFLIAGNLLSQFLPALRVAHDSSLPRRFGGVIVGFYLALSGVLLFSLIPIVTRVFLSRAADLMRGGGMAVAWLRPLGDTIGQTAVQDKIVLAVWTVIALGLAVAFGPRGRP